MEVAIQPVPVNHTTQSRQVQQQSQRLTISLLPSTRVAEQVIDSMAKKTLRSLIEREIIFAEITIDL